MKKLLITITATLVCVGAFAQGKLAFQLSSTTAIYFTTDKTQLAPADENLMLGGISLAGSGAYTGPYSTIAALAGSPSFKVTLYAGATASSLAPVASTTINNYNYEGTLVQQDVTLADLPPGTAAYFQIQVYDSRSANAAAAWAAGQYLAKAQSSRPFRKPRCIVRSTRQPRRSPRRCRLELKPSRTIPALLASFPSTLTLQLPNPEPSRCSALALPC